MTTEFGKFLRILRIKHDMAARELATALNVSTAYLSSVENGKRNIPSVWENGLISVFNLGKDEQAQLRKAIAVSSSEFKVDLSDADDKKRQLIMKIAKDNLDSQTIDKLCFILEKEKMENNGGLENL